MPGAAWTLVLLLPYKLQVLDLLHPLDCIFDVISHLVLYLLGGGAGIDFLFGGRGADKIDGGADFDLASGGKGIDTCYGVEFAVGCEK